MIVKCAKCQAGYEFPVEQLPSDGLRAKCASCKHVMWIRADGTDGAPVDSGAWRRPGRALGEANALETPVSTLPPPVVAPPQHERTPVPEPAPAAAPVVELTLPSGAPRQQAGRDVAQVQRDERVRRGSATANRGFRVASPSSEGNKRKRKERTVQTAPKAEKDTEQGPSVIIDMGQLSGGAASDPVEAPPEPTGPDPAAFAPLSTAPPVTPKARAPIERAPNAFDVEAPADIKAVRPPRMWPFVLLLAVLGLGTFVLLVWWRNDWRPIWHDPAAAFEVAIGRRELPALPPENPVPIVEAAVSDGTLVVQQVELEPIRLRDGDRAALVKGVVSNQTNRFQKAIGIEVSLVEIQDEGPLKLKTRIAPCCVVIGPDEAKEIALDPEHPHFSEQIDSATQARLAPGESRPFAVVLTGLGKRRRGQEIQAAASIKFSEPE